MIGRLIIFCAVLFASAASAQVPIIGSTGGTSANGANTWSALQTFNAGIRVLAPSTFSVSNLAPTGIYENLNVTSNCLGNNLDFIGCSNGYFQAKDDVSVTNGTKGVLYGLQLSIRPLISRNNSPADDATGLVIQNDAPGTFLATDAFYLGHNSLFTGTTKEWQTGFLAAGNTNAAFAIAGGVSAGIGLDMCWGSCSVIGTAAIRVPNNVPGLVARNAAASANVEIARVNASDQVSLAGGELLLTSTNINPGADLTYASGAASLRYLSVNTRKIVDNNGSHNWTLDFGITSADGNATLAHDGSTYLTLSSAGLLSVSSLSVSGSSALAGVTATSLDGAAIGSITPSTIAATTIRATGQITSTLANGTAPLVVASSTVVANLNASQLLGATWVSPGIIGNTTPAPLYSYNVGLGGSSGEVSNAKTQCSGSVYSICVYNNNQSGGWWSSSAGSWRQFVDNSTGALRFGRLTGSGPFTVDTGIDNTALGATTASTARVTTLTASSTVTLSGLSTGTNADFLCLSASNLVLIQASACTISSLRFKDVIGPVSFRTALDEIMALHPIVFTVKANAAGAHNADWNARRPQLGITAENVAAVDPRMAIYEQDGMTPKSYRQESVIAALIGAVHEQQAQIDGLKAQIAKLQRRH